MAEFSHIRWNFQEILLANRYFRRRNRLCAWLLQLNRSIPFIRCDSNLSRAIQVVHAESMSVCAVPRCQTIRVSTSRALRAAVNRPHWGPLSVGRAGSSAGGESICGLPFSVQLIVPLPRAGVFCTLAVIVACVYSARSVGGYLEIVISRHHAFGVLCCITSCIRG